jgi:hypothetical protein
MFLPQSGKEELNNGDRKQKVVTIAVLQKKNGLRRKEMCGGIADPYPEW